MDHYQTNSHVLETVAPHIRHVNQEGNHNASYYRQPSSSLASKQESEDLQSENFNHVLLLCEDEKVRGVLQQFLEKEGFQVAVAPFNAIHRFSNQNPNAAVLVDLGLNTIQPETLFTYLERFVPHVPVIIMDEINRLSEHKAFCLRKSFSYMSKPCNRGELLHDLRLAQKHAKLLFENRQLRQSAHMPPALMEFYGSSPQYELTCKKIDTCTRLDGPVLLVGEKGVGKEMLVQHIHMGSARARHPLLIVPCDSLPDMSLESMLFGHIRDVMREEPFERVGVLEIADQGTVYLDKIHKMPIPVQSRLCQFLKDGVVRKIGSNTPRVVNTRIIATSNNDLSPACRHGRFHEELYYRLNSMSIAIRPLREQIEDIPSYAKNLLTRYAHRHKTSLPVLSHAAITKLQCYSWPGNIREFRNVIYRACYVAKDTVINEEDIVFDSIAHDSRNTEGRLNLAGMTMAEIERRAIIETIHACGGNRAESARQLGISEKTIYNKFRQFKLKGIV